MLRHRCAVKTSPAASESHTTKQPLSGPHPWVAVLKGHTVQDRVRQAQLFEAVTPKAALQPMSVRSSVYQRLLGVCLNACVRSGRVQHQFLEDLHCVERS